MIEEIRRQISYDANTGVLTRISGRFRGEIRSKQAQGYIQVRVGKKYFAAHRIAWLLYYGEWPSDTIDHANGVKDDNRIRNLRLANKREQSFNRAVRPDNVVGIKGVRRHAGRWQARITTSGKRVSLGHFDDVREASLAYDVAAKEAFGVFAVLNGELDANTLDRAASTADSM